MTKADNAPAIGTPEGAVRACVALIASVTGQPEELTERYLDLYYQVRRQAEDAAERERILRCWDVGTPVTVVPNDGPPRAQGESAQIAERRRPGPSAPTDATGETEKPAAPAQKKVDFEEVLASASAGAQKSPENKKRFAPYGAIKAEILSRYIDLRAKGMTIAQTVNLSGGKVSEGKILTIMNGGKVGMDAYNAIEDAMNKWEQITANQATDMTDLIPN